MSSLPNPTVPCTRESTTGLTSEEENRLLSDLKADVITKARAMGGASAIPKGHPVSEAAASFGKMAAAVSKERGIEPNQLMKEIQPSLKVDEGFIEEQLHLACVSAMSEEVEECGRMIRGSHVGNKVQSATEHFERSFEGGVHEGMSHENIEAEVQKEVSSRKGH